MTDPYDDEVVESDNFMEIPPWHLGDVIRKMMRAHPDQFNAATLANRANLGANTIGNLLETGKAKDTTVEAVCRALGCDRSALLVDMERSNVWRTRALPMRERPERTDAEEYTLRLLRLSTHAQTAIFNVIRAFEEAFRQQK